jgi:hypothetical protein
VEEEKKEGGLDYIIRDEILAEFYGGARGAGARGPAHPCI